MVIGSHGCPKDVIGIFQEHKYEHDGRDNQMLLVASKAHALVFVLDVHVVIHDVAQNKEQEDLPSRVVRKLHKAARRYKGEYEGLDGKKNGWWDDEELLRVLVERAQDRGPDKRLGKRGDERAQDGHAYAVVFVDGKGQVLRDVLVKEDLDYLDRIANKGARSVDEELAPRRCPSSN